MGTNYSFFWLILFNMMLFFSRFRFISLSLFFSINTDQRYYYNNSIFYCVYIIYFIFFSSNLCHYLFGEIGYSYSCLIRLRNNETLYWCLYHIRHILFINNKIVIFSICFFTSCQKTASLRILKIRLSYFVHFPLISSQTIFDSDS